MADIPPYKLIGQPRLQKSRGRIGTKYVQRYRLLNEPSNRVRVVSLDTSDKSDARTNATQYVEAAIMGDKPTSTARASKSLSDHLCDYIADLRADDRDAKYVKNHESRIKRLATGCGFNSLNQIDPQKIRLWLAERRSNDEIGMQTSIHFVASIKQFCNWLVRHNCIKSDPLCNLSKKPKGDVPIARPRRMFSQVEFAKLVKNAQAGPVNFGLSGYARTLLYLTASQTGYRVQELSSITPICCHLNGEIPCVKIDCRRSKRRRYDVQEIQSGLADLLRRFIKDKADDEPLWPGAWWRRANEMLEIDMTGIERETPEGWLQFHSLRHTMVTNVTGNTKSEALAMEICRISSPELLRRYYHPSQSDRQKAVESLPMPKIRVR